MPVIALDLLSAGALLVLLVVAFVHPPSWVEGLSGLLTAGVLLAAGALTWGAAAEQVELMLPVVLFLSASLVVAEMCAAEGVFSYLGSRISALGGADPRRLLVVTLVAAAAVTVVLSLDATVVMLTPVVLAAAAGGPARRPLTHLCVRLANSASLLLPVSNLTNLLALPRTGLGFVAWAAVMALPWLSVLLVEYTGVRLFFATDLVPAGAAQEPAVAPADDAPPRYVLSVLALMLLGFAAGSALSVPPFWVAGAAALLLGAHAHRRRRATWRRLGRATHLPFAVFVVSLGVVVAGVSTTFLGDLLADLLSSIRPAAGSGPDLLDLVLVAVVATGLANVVNNLPATLLLVPLAAPLGTAAMLAMLVGVNVGAGLTYTGSLANLLWRRVLVRHGEHPSTATFHLQAAMVTPLAVLAAVLVVWLESSAGWIS